MKISTLFDHSFLNILPLLKFTSYQLPFFSSTLSKDMNSRANILEAESPHDHQAYSYISISAVTPTSYASCFVLSSFFFSFFSMQRRRRTERDQTTHTDPGLHPPTPSLQFPRHLCTSLCLQLHNNKALNLRRGVNPSREKERKRRRKGSKRIERTRGGGGVGAGKRER